MSRIRLSAFSDEAGSPLCEQIAALHENGIALTELRSVAGKNVADLTLGEAKQIYATLSGEGIGLSAVGSPMGKVSINVNIDEYLDVVKHICELACTFETDRIRMFSFFESHAQREKVIENLAKMVEVADSYGVGLYHENEKAIYGDTLERVLDIMNEIDGLKYIYDPANYLEVGEKADDTLNAFHAKTDYFHIKDVIAESGTLVPAGCGDGKIDELIARISPEDDKVLTLEPHLKVFEGFAEIDGTEMKNKYHFATNEEAFDAAVTALKGLLEAAGYKYNEKKGGYVK